MGVGFLMSLRCLNKVISPITAIRRKRFFIAADKLDFYQIPIFIISYNRLSYLENLIKRLQKMGYKNINIIDNNSTYQPLIDYYERSSCKVFRLSENYGHMAFWKSELFDSYRKSLYAVTDPDIMPVDECPEDFMEVFYKLIKKYPGIRKAGFSLKIDDIPEDAPLHNDVIAWERHFYYSKIPFENAYVADIDTTFALYIPEELSTGRTFLTAIRTAAPYQARHLPWYKKRGEAGEEQIYYAEHRDNGFWDEVNGKRTGEGIDVNE